jgi:Pentapeptide repeats (8 copies)
MDMSWFFGKPRVRAMDAGQENGLASAEVARELKQLRISTAAGLERLQGNPAQAPAKSRWDKATVIIQAIGAVAIIVPLIALFVSISQFSQQQKDSATATLEQQRVTAAAALDQQRQATLSEYFDDMSVLVLQYNLPKSKPGDPVRAIAVARTLTAVRDLDGARKATLIRYLWEADLLEGAHPIVNIYNAVLTGAVFDNANLDGIALFNQLFLNGVQFINRTSLIDADLSESHLYEADLETAILTNADLRDSFPIAANFAGANLQGADLAGADLTGANLRRTLNLAQADLKGALYNVKPEDVTNPENNQVVKPPTQWPPGFNPQAEGADCYDCARSKK